MNHRIDWETLAVSLAVVLAFTTWVASLVGLAALGYLAFGTAGVWLGSIIWLVITSTAMLYHYWAA